MPASFHLFLVDQLWLLSLWLLLDRWCSWVDRFSFIAIILVVSSLWSWFYLNEMRLLRTFTLDKSKFDSSCFLTTLRMHWNASLSSQYVRLRVLCRHRCRNLILYRGIVCGHLRRLKGRHLSQDTFTCRGVCCHLEEVILLLLLSAYRCWDVCCGAHSARLGRGSR